MQEERQPFGWLYPSGEFRETEWGDHEEEAKDIIREECYTDTYRKMCNDRGMYIACSDFLVYEMGFIIIDDPEMSGNYKVRLPFHISKKQKEFLYDYFISVGDKERATEYLNL